MYGRATFMDKYRKKNRQHSMIIRPQKTNQAEKISASILYN
jgi:hypothetical protein